MTEKEKRCELTNLLVDQCSHCQQHYLGDEDETSQTLLEFKGLLDAPKTSRN